MKYFDINRYYAIFLKEVIHMLRDKVTIGLVIGYTTYSANTIWLCYKYESKASKYSNS